MILGVTIAASLLTTGVVIAATNVAVGQATTTPTKDLVGTGLFNCAAGSGEVGYSPVSISGGTTLMMVSVWLQGTKCTAAKGATAKPLPTTVVLSFSLSTTITNTCPLLGTIGTGNANLAYNFPPVPAKTMIDPSVAQSATLVQSGAYWEIYGGTWWGSYPTTSTSASPLAHFHPIVVPSTASCTTGINSEYIDDVTLQNV
jgi:hypothetical protein